MTNINKGLEPAEKKLVEHINMTPKWVELVDVLASFIEHGDAMQQQIAREQMMRMARAADAYNAEHRVKTPENMVMELLDTMSKPYDRDGYTSGSDGW